MSYIAKAMNKQTGFDAEAEGAARERGAQDAGGQTGDAGDAPGPATPELEFVRGDQTRPQEPRVLSPHAAARTLAGMNSRTRPEAPELPPEMLGTLEGPPPEPASSPEPPSRPWWKEPVLIGGGALGLAALFIGFLFAPGGDAPAPPSAAPADPATPAQMASEAPSEDGAAQADREADGETQDGSATGRAEKSSGDKPVVVRVQIDSGDGRSVQFDSGAADAAGAPPSAPRRPEVYEPLQPLELPPPPVADYDVEEPEPSSSGSRYASPPAGDAISDYRLEGIFWSEENPGVIINDEILDEGERVNQLRVLDIHKDYVVVELHGRTYDLR